MTSSPPISIPPISIAHARSVMLAAQGLLAPGEELVPTLERTGFVRTLGGVDVYLAVRARVPDIRRSDVDTAAAAGEIKVIPAARGCIYLVPRRYVPAALALASRLAAPRDARDQARAGIRDGEVEEVAETVLAVLREKGPSTTAALRRALPDGSIRSLGDAGKKVGLSSTLPPALRWLEFAGSIERINDGERLDNERYRWRPVAEPVTPVDGDEVLDTIGEIYFRAAGLGSRKGLAAWAGIKQGEAKAVVDRLPLIAVEADGLDDTQYLLAERSGWLDDPPEVAHQVAFLPFEDSLVSYRGGPGFLVDPRHHDVAVPKWGRAKGKTLGDVTHAAVRTMVIGGQLRGFWEYDPDEEAVVTAPLDPLDPALRSRVDEAATSLGSFVRDELGHGRSFSLDTDDKLRERVAFLRTLGR